MTLLDAPLEGRLRNIEDRLTSLERDVGLIKTDIAVIKTRLEALPTSFQFISLILPLYGFFILGVLGIFYFLLSYVKPG